jgi:hypothetical protein
MSEDKARHSKGHMQFKDANGTLLKDGDYILSTGDGVGAFTMKGWWVGVFRQRREDGYCVEPLVPPADGSYTVYLPVLEYATYTIDQATAWAVENTAKETSRIYRLALSYHRKGQHGRCVHGEK